MTMAANNHSPTEPAQNTTPDTESQLEYPQLLIEASFASLLSHSQSSQPRTEVQMPRSEVSLSESWSSLSERDLLHDDDDLNSNATDTGSLIDGHTTRDVHSVDEYGQSSDVDDNSDSDEEQDEMGQPHHGTQTSHKTHDFQSQYSQARLQESIRLEDSTVIVDSSGLTSLQASKTFPDIGSLTDLSDRTKDEVTEKTVGTIQMSFSCENLKLTQSPYHILYYGSPLSSPEIKSDVLGKIGAALISPGESSQYDSTSESPCFHVIPSEFGPGSRPSIADLIPIPTQMHITECTVANTSDTYRSDSSINLVLNNGKHVTSRQHRYFEHTKPLQWKLPELVVVVVSRNETQTGRAKAKQVVDFARRHDVALLCLRQEAGWIGDDFLVETDPHMLHKRVQPASSTEESSESHKMLLDVDSFLALDTEQLNRHLSYLANASIVRREQFGSLSNACKGLSQKNYRQAVEALGLLPPRWVVQISSPKAPTAPKAKEEPQKSSSVRKGSWFARLSSIMDQVQAVLIPIAATLMIIYACQTATPYLMSLAGPKMLSLPGAQTGGHEIVCTKPASRAAALTVASDQYGALSGPLLAADRQIQKYLPQEILNTRSCQKIVPAHIGASLKVEAKWFESGEPKFRVHVVRGDEVVAAALERQADGAVAVLIKREDMYGELMVHLDGQEGYVCGSIDLKDSVDEALTMWLKSLYETYPGRKTAKKAIDTYRRLLEIRGPNTGLVSRALELKNSATQKIGAAMEAVEKSAIRQAKFCHKHRDECFPSRIGQLRRSIAGAKQQARQMSEEMLQKVHNQIVDSTQHIRSQVNEVNSQVQGEIAKAIQVVQTSVQGATSFANAQTGQVKDTLNEAQQRAQKLVKKPRSHRRKGHRN